MSGCQMGDKKKNGRREPAVPFLIIAVRSALIYLGDLGLYAAASTVSL